MIGQQPIDPRAALAQAIASQQLQVQQPHLPRAQALQGYQQLAQALARQMATQRQPLGRARVTQPPRDRLIDGGVPGAEPAFRHSPGYQLRAGMGIGGALNSLYPQLMPGGFRQ